MARKSGHNKPFLRKGGGKAFKYKWGPFQDTPKDIDARRAKKRKKQESERIVKCNATPGSQGFDNKVTYTYHQQLVGGVIQNGAYVECDYVV
jgi:hypothetical protein